MCNRNEKSLLCGNKEKVVYPMTTPRFSGSRCNRGRISSGLAIYRADTRPNRRRCLFSYEVFAIHRRMKHRRTRASEQASTVCARWKWKEVESLARPLLTLSRPAEGGGAIPLPPDPHVHTHHRVRHRPTPHLQLTLLTPFSLDPTLPPSEHLASRRYTLPPPPPCICARCTPPLFLPPSFLFSFSTIPFASSFFAHPYGFLFLRSIVTFHAPECYPLSLFNNDSLSLFGNVASNPSRRSLPYELHYASRCYVTTSILFILKNFEISLRYVIMPKYRRWLMQLRSIIPSFNF